MIEVKNLAFSYGDHEVLKDISIHADYGEMLCVLGANGAGKSTLFKCMLGLLKGYSGQIVIDGDVSDKLSDKERACRVAYIPQATRPAFSYSVLEMVMMGTTVRLSALGNPGRKERAEARAMLEKLGIAHLESRGYSNLSGGEQQLVLIARALVQGAKILVMDEPTSALDYGNQLRVQQQLRGLVAEGYSIIQSTHNPEQTYMFADRIACIKDGCVIREGKPADVMDEELIQELYGIEVNMISTKDDRVRFFEIKER